MILPAPKVTEVELLDFALSLGIKEDEYYKLRSQVERIALKHDISFELAWNTVTIAMYSVERSEHCDYPHSREYIARLISIAGKKKYPVLRGADSGGVILPSGLVVLFKMESHNHPSQVEPYQGAATGIGGIVRDIFTMGARPVALLDPIFFGPLNDPLSRYIFEGVVSGISGYGNCLGIPNLGGQVFWGDGFLNRTLVNVMCAGIGENGKIVSTATATLGSVVLICGRPTGRDGIGGASVLASQTYSEGEEKRVNVQIGDPFSEKLLMEAYLECVDVDLIEAGKDMGAAGITCTTTETCEASGVGMDIDLALAPLYEEGMYAHEVVMSESQERMLIVAKPENVSSIREIFEDKWQIPAVPVGFVTAGPLLRLSLDGKSIAVIDPTHMVGGPPIDLKPREPTYIGETRKFDAASLPQVEDYRQVLLQLLSSPNIASKQWIYYQYDRSLGSAYTHTLIEAGRADAGVLRIKGSKYGVVLTADCNPRYCYLDPEKGAAIAVVEAARNLVCTGAEPAAVTDCLNFGDPDDPEVAWQFEQAINGIEAALKVLRIPIVSGNVSFYNQDDSGPVWPTPTIGMVGIMRDVRKKCTPGFKNVGDHIYVVGPLGEGELGGSEYLSTIHGVVAGELPKLDLKMEKKIQGSVLQAIREGLLSSAHDCSDGGLLVAVAESVIQGQFGAHILLVQTDARSFFGESQSRIVVSLPLIKSGRLKEITERRGVPLTRIGVVGEDELIVESFKTGKEIFKVSVAELVRVWRTAIEQYLNEKTGRS